MRTHTLKDESEDLVRVEEPVSSFFNMNIVSSVLFTLIKLLLIYMSVFNLNVCVRADICTGQTGETCLTSAVLEWMARTAASSSRTRSHGPTASHWTSSTTESTGLMLARTTSPSLASMAPTGTLVQSLAFFISYSFLSV